MSAEGTTDAAARAAEPPSATDPGVGGETTPPVTKLNSTEEVPAEKRARQPEEATGSGKTIVQPPEEVKARLAERQKKQRERAEAARAEAARRQAEEQAAAKDAASRGRDATPAGDGERFLYNKEKKAPAVSAVSEKDRLIARQKELAARRAAEKQASKRSPQTSALDANARFLAAAAARAAALKASGGAALSPTFKSASAPGPASAADTPPTATDASTRVDASTRIEVRSFEEVIAEKKRREAAVTDEARAAAAAAEAALVTKTIAVKTEDDQTVEITMKVHVPQERLAQLEARRAAKEAAKREREAREERARRDRLAMKTEEEKEEREEKEEERREPAAPVAATPTDLKEQTPVPAKRTIEPEEPEEPEEEKTPKPAPKRSRAKKSDAPAAAAEAPPKRARRSTRK